MPGQSQRGTACHNYTPVKPLNIRSAMPPGGVGISVRNRFALTVAKGAEMNFPSGQFPLFRPLFTTADKRRTASKHFASLPGAVLLARLVR